MTNAIARHVEEHGFIPLSWAAGTRGADYLNLGDALSPAMLSMLTGLPIQHEPMVGDMLRMASVGSIGQNYARGEVWFWGTGSSHYANGTGGEKTLYSRPADTDVHICSTRGPFSRKVLNDGAPVAPDSAFGDPVWILPDFYPGPVEKKWDLGVLIHLVDLADRDFEAHPKDYARYGVPEEFAGSVKLLNTVTPKTVDGLKQRLDDILSCRRLVSTSLHGMVFAESYGIPCLYFGVRGPNPGLATVHLDVDNDKQIDTRFTDLYLGMGKPHLPIYVQDRKRPTDWADVMRAVDRGWEPIGFDPQPMIDACPLPTNPIKAPEGGTIFDHPLIRDMPLLGGERTAI